MADPLVAVESVSKRFGSTRALRDVSLEIERGVSHALVGRNGAGKSTLVGVLTGLLVPDDGVVRFDGKPAPAAEDRRAWQELVACVYQHSRIVPHLTVAENLFLNRHPARRGGLVRWRELNRRARKLLEQWNVDVPAALPARDLTVEQRQLVEIARALAFGASFIILDEPTAELESREIARLFERIESLQRTGITFLYISHHLEEVYEICDIVTVLRNGERVTTEPVSELPEPELITAMVGEGVAGHRRVSTRRTSDGDVATMLDVRGLTKEGAFHDVTFSVGAGECVALAGLAGSGKAELGDALAGLVDVDSGEISVEGAPVRFRHASGAIAAGIGYVPQDRHARGMVPLLGVGENLTLPVLRRFARGGWIATRRRDRFAQSLVERLEIVTSATGQSVAELSGGNQQKVVVGRALASSPRVLVLLHPTAGVDVAAKEALFGIIEAARDGGAAVLVVSDEDEELAVCDRVLVIFRGALVREFGADRDDRELVAAMEGAEIG